MIDPDSQLTIVFVAIAGLGIVVGAALRAWRGWLDLKRLELSAPRGDVVSLSPATRIEMADLKERVRKLEAIASGVDY